MVYIRTDANEKIATGHVMRCLTIAEEIIQLGEMVNISCLPANPITMNT